MNEAQMTVIGYLGATPQLRFTPTGKQVTDLRVASTRKVKVGEAWEDRETTWFKVSCWNDMADNVTSLKSGDRVVVVGKLVTVETYLSKDGSTGVNVVLDPVSVGADVTWNKVTVQRPVREGSTAVHFPERWDEVTGEVLDEPVEEIAA